MVESGTNSIWWAAWDAAKRARVPLLLRPLFSLSVWRECKSGRAFNDALNRQLSRFVWRSMK